MRNGKLIATLMFLTAIFTFSCNHSGKLDKILDKPVSAMNAADLQILTENGYLQKNDNIFLGQYLIELTQRNHSDSIQLTIGQALDSMRASKNKMNHQMAMENNFGTDSIYIRMPNGDRFFLGMGQATLETLVEHYSTTLPNHYEGDYNLQLSNTDAMNRLSQMIAAHDHSWLVGNVMLIERDQNNLKTMRIGDVFEIAQRIAESHEFAPFVAQMDKR